MTRRPSRIVGLNYRPDGNASLVARAWRGNRQDVPEERAAGYRHAQGRRRHSNYCGEEGRRHAKVEIVDDTKPALQLLPARRLSIYLRRPERDAAREHDFGVVHVSPEGAYPGGCWNWAVVEVAVPPICAGMVGSGFA